MAHSITIINEAASVSEARFLLVANNIQEGVILLDASNKVQYVSPACIRQFGYSHTDDISEVRENIFSKMHPQDSALFVAKLLAATAYGKTSLSFIAHVLNKTDQYVLIEKNVYLSYDAAGKYSFSVIVCNDLSANYQLEQSRLNAVGQLHKIASHLPGVIYQWRQKPGGNSSMPYASDALFQIFGLYPDEVKDNAEKMYGAIYTADLNGFKTSMSASAQNLTAWQHEYRCLKPDGSIRFLYGNAAPEKEADGSILWNGFITDITEKKLGEQSLKDSEARFKAMFKGHGAVMLLVHPDSGKIIDANEAAEKFYGYSHAVLCLMNISDINVLPADELSGILETAKKGIEKNYKMPHVLANGTRRTVQVLTSPISYDGGKVLFSIINDITEKEFAELELKAKSAEIADSNRLLEHFAAVASHDLQEPLRMVSSFLQALEKRLDGQLDEKSMRYLTVAADGALRMQLLINDLLQYSKVSSNEKFAVVDVNELLEYLQLVISKNFDEAPVIKIAGSMPKILASKALITQVFMNLVKNAIKYTINSPAEVNIGYTEDSTLFSFYVADNGIGIDEEYHEAVFELFRRLHTASEYSGTGVGLALCKRIVEIHGGRIWVNSAKDQGSTFYFTIPK